VAQPHRSDNILQIDINISQILCQLAASHGPLIFALISCASFDTLLKRATYMARKGALMFWCRSNEARQSYGVAQRCRIQALGEARLERAVRAGMSCRGESPSEGEGLL
jgi:hypothetical protein